MKEIQTAIFLKKTRIEAVEGISYRCQGYIWQGLVKHCMGNRMSLYVFLKINRLFPVCISENSSKEFMHTAQTIDLTIEAHDASVMFIAVNLAWIAESSVALQQVGPL